MVFEPRAMGRLIRLNLTIQIKALRVLMGTAAFKRVSLVSSIAFLQSVRMEQSDLFLHYFKFLVLVRVFIELGDFR